MAVALVTSVAHSAHADKKRYDLLFFGYQAFATDVGPITDSAAQSGMNQNLPTMWADSWGKSFYYRYNWGYGFAALFDFIGIGSTAQFGKDNTMYRNSGLLIPADFEGGPHWSVGPGLLGVGVSLELMTLGAGRVTLDQGSIPGGRGGTCFDLGAALQYTMPMMGFLRINPGVTYAWSSMGGTNNWDYTGTSLQLEVAVIARLTDFLSVHGKLMRDSRTYTPTEKNNSSDELTISASGLWIGVTLHGSYGWGTNDF